MENDKRFDSGFALVITLLLVLILILMAAGVSYTGGANIELINAVSHKHQSMLEKLVLMMLLNGCQPLQVVIG